MSNIYLNIPKNIKVGLKGKLGYIIYKREDGKIAKEKSWNDWRNKEQTPLELVNEPTEGFSIERAVGGGGGWSARKAWCRIQDPRGFEFEISFENLIFLLNYCGYEIIEGKGIFKSAMVYGWDGFGSLVLTPVNSPDYIHSLEVDATKDYAPKDCKVGEWYQTKCYPTKYYRYCGKYNVISWNRVKTGYHEYKLNPVISEVNIFRTFEKWNSGYISKSIVTYTNSAKIRFFIPNENPGNVEGTDVDSTLNSYFADNTKVDVSKRKLTVKSVGEFSDKIMSYQDELRNSIMYDSSMFRDWYHELVVNNDNFELWWIKNGRFSKVQQLRKNVKNNQIVLTVLTYDSYFIEDGKIKEKNWSNDFEIIESNQFVKSEIDNLYIIKKEDKTNVKVPIICEDNKGNEYNIKFMY